MTRKIFRIAATMALASTTQVLAAVPAAQKPCMTQAELHGMVAYAMPSLMALVVDRCKAALPGSAVMLTRGPQLIGQLEAGRSAAYPMARAAFLKFADQGDTGALQMMQNLPETAFRPIMDGIITEKLGSSINVKNCADIDHVYGTLTPLPAANFIDFVTQIVTISAREDKKMAICPA